MAASRIARVNTSSGPFRAEILRVAYTNGGSGMGGGSAQFGVTPEVLTELAGKFGGESRGLAKEVGTFSAGASGVGQAFGLLGACDGATAKYQQLLDSTVKALGQLSKALAGDERGLRINATNYSASDQAAVEYLRSVTR
jgi:uncharacterized protein YukE